jgi:hypothetical protein
MGIGISLLLIAVGAILAWGVTAHVQGLDVNTIGVIVMIVGLVGLILTLILWRSWWGPGYFRRTTYGRRGTYVEESEPPPPY